MIRCFNTSLKKKKHNDTRRIKIIFLFIFFFGAVQQLYAQSTGDYRSVTSGNWNVTGTWQRFNGTSWVTPTAAPTYTDGSITIQSGHTVTVTANVSIEQTTVDAGGQITVNSGVTLTG